MAGDLLAVWRQEGSGERCACDLEVGEGCVCVCLRFPSRPDVASSAFTVCKRSMGLQLLQDTVKTRSLPEP